MTASDSSTGGIAGEFHIIRWAVPMVSTGGHSVSAALCDALIAAEGRLGCESGICRICGGTRQGGGISPAGTTHVPGLRHEVFRHR